MKLKQKLIIGIKVYRGVHPHHCSADSGDFGRGIYYTTSKAMARAYGEVKIFYVAFNNPLILSVEQAYKLGADIFNTIGNNPYVDKKIRIKNCERLTKYLLRHGYDCLVCIHKRKISNYSSLEIVDYRPYL